MPLEPARARLASPAWFAAAVLGGYLLVIVPMLARHHFDASVFIIAGDRFVHINETPTRIIIRSHSAGYDGQFYYRLALTPWLGEATADGVTLDHPAWRMQRILLPLLARTLAFGNSAAIPGALLIVNLAGIFAVAWLAMQLARQHNFPFSVPLAIVAWPGFLIALTHDTTEIIAAAFLLAAITAWMTERAPAYAACMALATLARETPVLAAFGFLAVEFWHLVKARAAPKWKTLLYLGAALLPFLIWRQIVAAIWHDSPQAHGVTHNAGLPLAGWAEALLANFLNRGIAGAPAQHDLADRLTMLVALAAMAVSSVRLLMPARRQLRERHTAGLAAAWLLTLALMTLLTANGPLIDSTALFRALTEYWVLGCLLSAFARVPIQLPWLPVFGGPLLIRTVHLCWVQIA